MWSIIILGDNMEDIYNNKNTFANVSINSNNEKWDKSIKRLMPIEHRKNDIRSEFGRDYTRILHSLGYRRLKHKTQVFFAPNNDHICTRIEHVNHVESVSYTIANFLGLNTELTKAISIGHDIGHAPFGHLGETIIKNITEKELGQNFWHEQNGLHFIDDVEHISDENNIKTNLNLTYGVRDGVISHCGEINQNGLFPRKEYIDLNEYKRPNQYSPYTWEGCVVKISDKISYLGRDIEDAIMLKIISYKDIKPLLNYCNKVFLINLRATNPSSLMHLFIIDLCQNSSIDRGLSFSQEVFDLMKAVMSFNYEKIYRNEKLNIYTKYAEDIINTIYTVLCTGYDGLNTYKSLEQLNKKCPDLVTEFITFIISRWDLSQIKRNNTSIIYNISYGEKEYKKAVIDYISGMTDNFAKRMYDSLCAF